MTARAIDEGPLVAQRQALAALCAERYGDFVALAWLTSGRSASAEVSAQLHGDRDVVRAALATLPPRQRECAVCHFQFGLSQTETAEVLGLRHGTVKTHLGRARQALVRALEEHT